MPYGRRAFFTGIIEIMVIIEILGAIEILGLRPGGDCGGYALVEILGLRPF